MPTKASRNRWMWIVVLALLCPPLSEAAQTAGRNNDLKRRVIFEGGPLKTALKQLSGQLKINVVFDETFRDQPNYTLDLNDVTAVSAMKIILIQTRHAARLIEENTLIIFQDNSTVHARLAEYPVWPAKPEKK